MNYISRNILMSARIVSVLLLLAEMLFSSQPVQGLALDYDATSYYGYTAAARASLDQVDYGANSQSFNANNENDSKKSSEQLRSVVPVEQAKTFLEQVGTTAESPTETTEPYRVTDLIIVLPFLGIMATGVGAQLLLRYFCPKAFHDTHHLV